MKKLPLLGTLASPTPFQFTHYANPRLRLDVHWLIIRKSVYQNETVMKTFSLFDGGNGAVVG